METISYEFFVMKTEETFDSSRAGIWYLVL